MQTGLYILAIFALDRKDRKQGYGYPACIFNFSLNCLRKRKSWLHKLQSICSYVHSLKYEANFLIKFTFTDIPELKLSYELANSDNSVIGEGDDVILYCQASANPPIQSVSWIFNQKKLGEYSISGRMENLTFTVKNLSHDSSGLYSCKARNSLGENQSKAVYIQVRRECLSRYNRISPVSHGAFHKPLWNNPLPNINYKILLLKTVSTFTILATDI